MKHSIISFGLVLVVTACTATTAREDCLEVFRRAADLRSDDQKIEEGVCLDQNGFEHWKGVVVVFPPKTGYMLPPGMGDEEDGQPMFIAHQDISPNHIWTEQLSAHHNGQWGENSWLLFNEQGRIASFLYQDNMLFLYHQIGSVRCPVFCAIPGKKINDTIFYDRDMGLIPEGVFRF